MEIDPDEPCSCGSGLKYKDCCLEKDQESRSEAAGEAQSGPAAPVSSPKAKMRRRRASRARRSIDPGTRRDELFDAFEALQRPSAAQMDKLLDGVLELPAELINWSDVIHDFARHGHPDLPRVFRRIVATVPHTRKAELNYFYWAAADEFFRGRLLEPLPEVAAGFWGLDDQPLDADALMVIEDSLLGARFEAEALRLIEHFLPSVRAGTDSGELTHYSLEQSCVQIYLLRVGRALRAGPGAATSPEALAQALRYGIEDHLPSTPCSAPPRRSLRHHLARCGRVRTSSGPQSAAGRMRAMRSGRAGCGFTTV